MFKKKISMWTKIGIGGYVVGISSSITAIILIYTHKSTQKNTPEATQKNTPEATQKNTPEATQKNTPETTQDLKQMLRNINGEQNSNKELFYFFEKKIKMDNNKGQQIELDIAKIDNNFSFFAKKTYSTKRKLEFSYKTQLNLLFENFLQKNKIDDKDFQKIKSFEELENVFSEDFIKFLEVEDKNPKTAIKNKILKENEIKLSKIIYDSKNILQSIKKKYDENFFEKNDLIILKGIQTTTNFISYLSHTPIIHSIKSNIKQIDIVIDTGQHIDEHVIVAKWYEENTTHFIAIPKNLPKILKVSFISQTRNYLK